MFSGKSRLYSHDSIKGKSLSQNIQNTGDWAWRQLVNSGMVCCIGGRGFDLAAVATAEEDNDVAINHLDGCKLDLNPGPLDFKTYPSNTIQFTCNMYFYSLILSMFLWWCAWLTRSTLRFWFIFIRNTLGFWFIE